MKAALYYGPGDVRCEQLPVPGIGDGEVLVRVHSCGLCGTDIGKMRHSTVSLPALLGHEVAGVVESVGGGVTRFVPGDRVLVAHHVPCFVCHECRHGAHSQCETFREMNIDPGGFAEFVRVKKRSVDRAMFHIPQGMSFEEASLVETAACCLRAVRLLALQPGDSVVVAGMGTIGLIHVLLLALGDASAIVATDPNPWRRERALRAGAALAVDPSAEGSEAAVREACGGRGADATIVAVGIPAAIEQAFSFTRPGGTVLVFGDCPPGSMVKIAADLIYHSGISLTGSYSSTPVDQAMALELAGSGRLQLSPVITHRFPLEGMGEAVSLAMGQGECLKVMILPVAAAK